MHHQAGADSFFYKLQDIHSYTMTHRKQSAIQFICLTSLLMFSSRLP
jgi:hypothetical protein